jgi:hypothetical protein
VKLSGARRPLSHCMNRRLFILKKSTDARRTWKNMRRLSGNLNLLPALLLALTSVMGCVSTSTTPPHLATPLTIPSRALGNIDIQGHEPLATFDNPSCLSSGGIPIDDKDTGLFVTCIPARKISIGQYGITFDDRP